MDTPSDYRKARRKLAFYFLKQSILLQPYYYNGFFKTLSITLFRFPILFVILLQSERKKIACKKSVWYNKSVFTKR